MGHWSGSSELGLESLRKGEKQTATPQHLPSGIKDLWPISPAADSEGHGNFPSRTGYDKPKAQAAQTATPLGCTNLMKFRLGGKIKFS